MNILDILLFPKRIYERINDKRFTLFLGFILVGFIDLMFPFNKTIPLFFINKPQGTFIYNLTLSCIFIICLGVIDVLFLSLPLFDLFNFFRKENNLKSRNDILIRIMKFYVLAHLLIWPISSIIYYLFGAIKPDTSPVLAIMLLFYFEIVMPVWFCAIITRGINVIYKFETRMKGLVFLIVYIWSTLLGYGLSYGIEHWVMRLFR